MRLFQSIPIGGHFESGGNLYRKRSTRTAEIVASRGSIGLECGTVHRRYSGVWGYFGQGEAVDSCIDQWRPCVRRAFTFRAYIST